MVTLDHVDIVAVWYIYIYVSNLNLAITIPADLLAPIGARPSAGTVLAEKLGMFSFTDFQWFCDTWHHPNQSPKSHSILRVNTSH